MPNRGLDPVPDFVGFANAPVDDDGKTLDFRDVDAYDAERDEAVKAPSSIQQFKTDDQSTDGAPAAIVPAPKVDDDESPDASPAEGEEGPQS